LVGAMSAASSSADVDHAVSAVSGEPSHDDVELVPTLETPSPDEADDSSTGRLADLSSADCSELRIDMLPWWVERLAGVEIHGQDGDTEYQMDAPSVSSGEVWASRATSGRRHSVDFVCQSFFSVDFMETSASGFRMQTSSSGIMTVHVRVAEDQTLAVIPEKIEGTDNITALAKNTMVPKLQERLRSFLVEFRRELDDQTGDIEESAWQLD